MAVPLRGYGLFFESFMSISHRKGACELQSGRGIILKTPGTMRLAFIIFVLLINIPGNIYAGDALFDISHRVIFQPDSEKSLGLKNFVGLFENTGNETVLSEEGFSARTLARFDVLVIPGSMRPYSKEEIDTIQSYVKNGGSLLVLLHIAPPLARLTERFGIILTNVVISESVNTINDQSQDFYARDIAPHPVTKGLKSIALYGSWGIMSEGKAKVIVSTSGQAWGDMNRNRKFDGGEPMQKFGLIAAAQFGKGRVVVVADDAPLANAFIGEADNMRLAKNIINWLTK